MLFFIQDAVSIVKLYNPSNRTGRSLDLYDFSFVSSWRHTRCEMANAVRIFCSFRGLSIFTNLYTSDLFRAFLSITVNYIA